MAWLWQHYQTPVNIRRLAKIALRRVASASRPAQFGRSQFVLSVGGQFHNSAWSESCFEGFITTICQVCALADLTSASSLPPSKMRRISILARKPNFARYLRDARIKRGLSVAEVADEVGVSTASIYFWETDRVRPRDANLSALCKVLRLPIRATREMAAA